MIMVRDTFRVNREKLVGNAAMEFEKLFVFRSGTNFRILFYCLIIWNSSV